MRCLVVAAAVLLAALTVGGSAPLRSKYGRVALPCGAREPLRPADPIFCRLARHYVTPPARDALLAAARTLAAEQPGTVLLYMDASQANGRVPMYPHFSHGDGRQVDLAVFYQDLKGAPLAAPPRGARKGYGLFEPPRPTDPQPCRGVDRPGDDRDPPAGRRWRLDVGRTKRLSQLLAGDGRVRRILIEPHLERRFGMEGHPRMRAPGCKAARHDDHLHVDFH